MAQSKVTSAQWALAFTATVGKDDVGNDVVIDVPPGFVLMDALLVVDVAFDGTTPTAALADNKASPTSIIASGALTVGAKTMVTAAKGTFYPSGGKLTLNPRVASGTVTTGSARLIVQGVVMGRQNERFGTSVAT